MPAFEEAEQLRLLKEAIERRIATMDRDHGTWTGDAGREGRNVPKGKGWNHVAESMSFGTGYNGSETTTPFYSDYSYEGGEDIVVG